jgi:aspartyl protease family protein
MRTRWNVSAFFVAIILTIFTHAALDQVQGQAQAQELKIRLIAAGTNTAIIEIDGERLVLNGENPVSEGVTLISSSGDEVIVLINDQLVTLTAENNAALVFEGSNSQPDSGSNSAVLWANSSGFFFANGTINGNSMQFLVDTGADIVTFSSVQANQLGIDYSRGKDGYASTASGIATLKTLSLDSLNIEGITLYDIPISVIQGPFPEVPLLGGTFLNQLNMNRIGNRMELSLP